MSNMSYCRFQNTVGDLQDCADALFDEKTISEDESRAKDRLIQLCCEIAESFGGMEYAD